MKEANDLAHRTIVGMVRRLREVKKRHEAHVFAGSAPGLRPVGTEARVYWNTRNKQFLDHIVALEDEIDKLLRELDELEKPTVRVDLQAAAVPQEQQGQADGGSGPCDQADGASVHGSL